MKILLIVFNQTGRGTYWRAFHMGRVLAERGHKVSLVTTSPRSRVGVKTHTLDGIDVIEMPDLLPGALRSGWDVWNIIHRLLWLRGKSFDIVHAFETRPTVIVPALAAKRAGSKLIIDWCDWFGRGGSVEERSNKAIRTVLRPVETIFEDHYRPYAHGTTVINTFLYERALSVGVKPDTILIVRNGSDTRRPLIAKDRARQLLGIPISEPWIGFVGGLYEQDTTLMAQALNQLRQRLPNARLALVGYFNRPIEGLLTDPAAVLRTGPISDNALVTTWLAACDLAWLPLTASGANRGRWPMKLNDYLTAGLPVIATDVGDMPGVVAAHGFGRVVSPTPEALAESTWQLLGDSTELGDMGRASRLTAESHLNWIRIGTELDTFYRIIQGQVG